MSGMVQADSSPKFTKLKLGTFVAVLYAYCAAGPFGFEDMVSKSGPGMALVFLFLVPWLFSLPISLATAELASAMPVEGGFYRWSRRAFGKFWGFQCGWWNWVGTFLMNAAYASILADYTVQLFPQVSMKWQVYLNASSTRVSFDIGHWSVALFFLALVACANIRGIQLVGMSCVVLLILCLLPVAVFTVVGLTHMKVNPFSPMTPPGGKWQDIYGVGLALGLWVYSGYEQLSTNMEEVEHPEKNFARGLTIMVPLAMVTFLLPMMAGIAAGNWRMWTSGYIVTAARHVGETAFGAVGGKWMEESMFVAAIISVLLGLQSTLLSSTRLPFTMAEDGFFHPWLAKLSPTRHTPVRAILLTTFICAPLAILDVTQLIATYIWLRVATSVMTLLSVKRLRFTDPKVPRGFRIPGGSFGLFLVVSVPLLLFAWTLFNSDPSSRIWGPLCLLTGPMTYQFLQTFTTTHN